MDEQSYIAGRKAMAASIIRECWDELNPDEKKIANLIIERQEIVAMLRQVCENHGDNDWTDELNLADVIEKHLWRHLRENPEPTDPDGEFDPCIPISPTPCCSPDIGNLRIDMVKN